MQNKLASTSELKNNSQPNLTNFKAKSLKKLSRERCKEKKERKFSPVILPRVVCSRGTSFTEEITRTIDKKPRRGKARLRECNYVRWRFSRYGGCYGGRHEPLAPRRGDAHLRRNGNPRKPLGFIQSSAVFFPPFFSSSSSSFVAPKKSANREMHSAYPAGTFPG